MESQENTGKQRKYLYSFWAVFILPIILIIVLFILISAGKMGFMPGFEELENPSSNFASEVISEDGELLGKFYYQNRSGIEYGDLNPYMVNALIAIEDSRFYNHSGIDARSLMRVLVRTILMGDRGQGGGSTITQQLAKNLFGRDTTVYRSKISRGLKMGVTKFKEWVIAVRLERNYTKEEIIAMYLNTVEFGHNAFGIQSAAKTFFNNSTDSLKIEEASLLAGMVKAPTRFSPKRNPELSRIRRNTVLERMNTNGFISKDQLDSLVQLPVQLEFKVRDHNVGLATYFRGYLRLLLSADKPERRQYYLASDYRRDSIEWETNPLYGWCNKNLKPDGTPYNLYRDGLRIYTTINSKMQQYAEEAVKEHLALDLQKAFNAEQWSKKNPPFSDNLDDEQVQSIIELAIRRTERERLLQLAGADMDSILKVFNTPVEMKVFSWDGEIDTIMSPLDSILYYKQIMRAGFMSMEPQTGHVKAYVGGNDYKYFKYDAVTQQRRQVGSTIKPFLYTLAMQNGYSPCHKVPNVPTTFQDGDTVWTPKNSGGEKYIGKWVTLKWGLANSVNYISAWLMKQFNPPAVIEVARKMGIESYIAPVPSMVLGTSDIKLEEMVAAYSVYPNKGVLIRPKYVTRIEDRSGNVLAEFSSAKEEVISEETAYLMVKLLQGVVDGGTAGRLRWKYELYNEIAGKTGTTQNHSDGWFMGFVPKLVSGVWVGAEDRSVHFKEIGLGQGANMALPIWALYMNKVYKDSTLNYSLDDEFEKPLTNFPFEIDCSVEDDQSDAKTTKDDLDFF